jgi:hypothetical protein
MDLYGDRQARFRVGQRCWAQGLARLIRLLTRGIAGKLAGSGSPLLPCCSTAVLFEVSAQFLQRHAIGRAGAPAAGAAACALLC